MTSTDKKPEIRVIRSGRRTLALSVQRDGSVLVRAPFHVPDSEILRFAESHRDWISRQLQKQAEAEKARAETEVLSREELEALAEEALKWFPEQVRRFAARIGVTYGRITVRNQKTKWGSCSSAGNLNFNCLLMMAPEQVRDYVIVHELCHRRQMNHSAAFWAEVERALPDYRGARQWLKQHGAELMLRNPHA
ncbi:MAG: M48 family metallopeptidase [Oscillospiraceae bacterium]|nr:M48 family metallopeptidase [Oscillospiraceae bacterium]